MNFTYLNKQLQKKFPDLAIFYNPHSESTMKDAKIATSLPAIFLADEQSQAHGRFQRPFYAEKENGLYFSLKLDALKEELLPTQFTILAGVALCLAIESISELKPTIKWVNDVFLNGKKTAGILAEGVLTGQKFSEFVIGLGINYSIPKDHFPLDIQHKVTSFFTNPPIAPEDFLLLFLDFFFQLKKEPFTTILASYKKRLFVLNRSVSFLYNQVEQTGIATDITPLGELKIQLNNGDFLLLNSGEISLTSY